MIDALILLLAVGSYLVPYAGTVGVMPLQAMALLAVLMYWLISLRFPSPREKFVLKIGLILLVISYTTIFSVGQEIMARRLAGPAEHTHDHPLQMEAAVKFLLEGRNPYRENYLQTPMYDWGGYHNNPALHHVIALPFTLIKSVPVYLLWQNLFGWYDERIAQLLLFGLALWAVYRLYDQPIHKLLGLIVIGLNPLLTPYFIEGRSDIVFLSLLLVSVLFLKQRRIPASLVFMALAVTSKHSSWFILPFYFLYLWQQRYFAESAWRKLLPFILPVAMVVVPFIVWDWAALYEDVYAYPAGLLPTSYPIQGLTTRKYFPFGILQLLLLPLLGFLWYRQRQKLALSQVLINYGIFVWAYWSVSRFFNDNYLGVVVIVLALGYLRQREEY